eukprot:g2552.t1
MLKGCSWVRDKDIGMEVVDKAVHSVLRVRLQCCVSFGCDYQCGVVRYKKRCQQAKLLGIVLHLLVLVGNGTFDFLAWPDLSQQTSGVTSMLAASSFRPSFSLALLVSLWLVWPVCGAFVFPERPAMVPVPLDEDDFLLFLRLQKTGSKAVTHMLRNAVNGPAKRKDCEQWFAASVPGFEKWMKRSEQYGCRLLADHHCDWKDLVQAPVWSERTANTAVVVVLRNPLDRTVAEFKHAAQKPKALWDYCPAWGKVPQPLTKKKFLEFVNDTKHSRGVFNRQTKMMAGIGDSDDWREKFPSERAMLVEAMSNLAQADVIGLTERMDDLVHLLNHRFQFNITSITQVKENADHSSVSFSKHDPEIKAAVMEHNGLDQILYDFAQDLLEQDMAQATSSRAGKPWPQIIHEEYIAGADV